MRVLIKGRDLPGRTFCRPDGSPLHDVRVGVQIRKEPADLIAGDATSARWNIDVTVTTDADGGLDFKGPAVHGKRGDRFLYLSWVNIGDDGAAEMFRRAKLMLHRVPIDLVRTADRAGQTLVATVRLSDEHGTPRCARVDPPDLEWTVAEST